MNENISEMLQSIKRIEEVTTELFKAFEKSVKSQIQSQKARVLSVKLEKLYKEFRKISLRCRK